MARILEAQRNPYERCGKNGMRQVMICMNKKFI